MAKRKAQSKPKRRRRRHSEEFKREAVKLVFDQNLSVSEAARNFGNPPQSAPNVEGTFRSGA